MEEEYDDMIKDDKGDAEENWEGKDMEDEADQGGEGYGRQSRPRRRRIWKTRKHRKQEIGQKYRV